MKALTPKQLQHLLVLAAAVDGPGKSIRTERLLHPRNILDKVTRPQLQALERRGLCQLHQGKGWVRVRRLNATDIEHQRMPGDWFVTLLNAGFELVAEMRLSQP